MRVICINNGYCTSATSEEVTLTEGRIYEVIEDMNPSYKIANDEGSIHVYHRKRFKTIEEYRQQKINSIIDEQY